MRSKDLLAATFVEGVEIHVVLLTDYAGIGSPDVDLMAFRDHYSNRTCVDSKTFSSQEEAMDYAAKVYGVGADQWTEDPLFDFRFDYQVRITNCGCPQPYLAAFKEGEIVFNLSNPQSTDGSGAPLLSISGSREGLRELAARLLLCADSQEYDPYYHIHLNAGVLHRSSNVEVILYSPTRFTAIAENALSAKRHEDNR